METKVINVHRKSKFARFRISWVEIRILMFVSVSISSHYLMSDENLLDVTLFYNQGDFEVPKTVNAASAMHPFTKIIPGVLYRIDYPLRQPVRVVRQRDICKENIGEVNDLLMAVAFRGTDFAVGM